MHDVDKLALFLYNRYLKRAQMLPVESIGANFTPAALECTAEAEAIVAEFGATIGDGLIAITKEIAIARVRGLTAYSNSAKVRLAVNAVKDEVEAEIRAITLDEIRLIAESRRKQG